MKTHNSLEGKPAATMGIAKKISRGNSADGNDTSSPLKAFRGTKSLETSTWYMSNLTTYLVEEEDSNGDFRLIEAVMEPGNEPPPHVHSREICEACASVDEGSACNTWLARAPGERSLSVGFFALTWGHPVGTAIKPELFRRQPPRPGPCRIPLASRTGKPARCHEVHRRGRQADGCPRFHTVVLVLQ